MSSLDKFSISGFVFFFQPVRFLARSLYTAHALHAFTLFSAQEFLMILENNVESELLHSNLVICFATSKAQSATHEFLNQQHGFHDKKTIPISGSLGFLCKGLSQ